MISIDEINRLIEENKALKEQLSKSVSNDLTLVAIKDFFQKVLNGEV